MKGERTRKAQGGRLAVSRAAAGFRSARAAAIENGWPESSYRAHETGTRTIGQDDADRYAKAYRARGVEVSAQQILFGAHKGEEAEAPQPDMLSGSIELGAPRPVRQVAIRGETAAGVWFEPDAFVDEDQPLVPVVPGKYDGLEQFSFKVVGSSMDKVKIFNGSYVVCVPYFEARGGITDGDIVVVERRKGQLIERTCKEVKIIRGGYELWPRSTDPRYQDPLHVKHRNRDAADGEEIEVVGLVIGVFAPI